jgi:hypothetical protein
LSASGQTVRVNVVNDQNILVILELDKKWSAVIQCPLDRPEQPQSAALASK